jgi:uncharacterized surface protein with fasciclin (FAS1) repeats
MASAQGFTDGSYDYKHMYNIKDINGPHPIPKFNTDTILGYLHNHNFEFAKIIESTDMAGKYNDIQADFSLFVPMIIPEWAHTLDAYKLKQLVLYHTLEHAVAYEFLKSSGAMFVNTRLPGSRLLVENVYTQTPRINNYTQILGYKQVGNAILFFIDKTLPLDNNPISNIDI